MRNWALILVILAVFCIFHTSSSYFRISQADDEEFADNFLAHGGGGGGGSGGGGGGRGGGGGGGGGGGRGGGGGGRSGGMSGGGRGGMSGGRSSGGRSSGGRSSGSAGGGRHGGSIGGGRSGGKSGGHSVGKPSGAPGGQPNRPGQPVGKPNHPAHPTGKPTTPIGKPANPIGSPIGKPATLANPSSVLVSAGINNGIPSATVQATTQAKNTQLTATATTSPVGTNLQLQSTTTTQAGKFGVTGNVGTDGSSIAGSASLNVGPGQLNLGASTSTQGPVAGSVGYSYSKGATTVSGQLSADSDGNRGAQVGVSQSIGKNTQIGAYAGTDFNGNTSGGVQVSISF